MNQLLRKLRGMMGIGLTWGILWAAITAAIGLVIGVTVPGSIGILGAAALPLLTGMEDKLMLIVCPLAAVFATASVAIARKAELHDSEHPKLLNSKPLPDDSWKGD